MTKNIISTDLDDVRIPHNIVDGLLSTSVAGIGDANLAARLENDKALSTRAAQMVQAILLTSTLAQSLSPDAHFDALLVDAPFSGADEGLMLIGKFMFAKISEVETIPDISSELLQDRFAKIYASI